MNAVDYVVIILLLVSVAAGVIRGAIREVMNIGGWVLAYSLARAYASDLAPLFADWVREPVARTLLGWVVVFLVVLVVVSLLASLLSEVVRKLGLSSLDRGVGALIGVARGLLILLAATLVVGLTRIPHSELWRQAAVTPWLEIAALYAKGVLPESIAAKISYRKPANQAQR